MSGSTRSIKTKRETIYRLLVESIDDPGNRSPDHDVYPFKAAYELFTAGLVVGYIENEQFDGEYDGDGDYHEWVRFPPFAENNPEHAACIDLLEKLIRLEHQSEENRDEEERDESDEDSEDEEDDDSDSQITWNDVVDYADKGVGALFAEWNEDHKIDLPGYFSSIESEVEERVELFEDDLRQDPSTGDQRDVSF